MCQLNLYALPKSVNKKEVISIFEKYGLYVDEQNYYKLHELEESYRLFSTKCHCDCGSIISRLQYEREGSFSEYKTRKRREDAEKLNRMKKLKNMVEYDFRAEEYIYRREQFWDVIDSFTQHTADYEAEESDKLLSSDLSEVELHRRFREELYPKLDEMRKEVEKGEDYQKALKSFDSFRRANQEMDEAIYYDIEENEKRISEYDFCDYHEQYDQLKSVYSELLNSVDEICLYPFWQDGGENVINERRQTDIDKLNIEHLLFLPFRSLLTIRKSIA